MPLVSICAIDPIVGVVVWQASLLDYLGGPSANGI